MDCRMPGHQTEADEIGVEPVEYITNDLTGTVHMWRFLDDLRNQMVTPVTLCGKRIDHYWSFGDETISGIASTCRKCRQILNGEPMNRPAGIYIVDEDYYGGAA